MTISHHYETEGSQVANLVLKLIPLMDKPERIRLAASILMVECNRGGGRLEMMIHTDEDRYTFIIERGEL